MSGGERSGSDEWSGSVDERSGGDRVVATYGRDERVSWSREWSRETRAGWERVSVSVEMF